MIRQIPVLFAMVLLGTAACSQSGDGGQSGGGTHAPSTAIQPRSTSAESIVSPPAPAPETTAAVLPAELVGTWESQSTNATIAYRFFADGRYSNVSILTQPRPSGVFEFSIEASGTASVDGQTLVLQPTRGTRTRKDPDDPAGDYTRPVSKKPERYQWSVGSSVLMLTDSTGLTIQYQRQ